MEKPYFLISSTSGKTQFLFDRRVRSDKDTLPMRNRLIEQGFIIKELSQGETDELLKKDKDWIIY